MLILLHYNGQQDDNDGDYRDDNEDKDADRDDVPQAQSERSTGQTAAKARQPESHKLIIGETFATHMS